MSNKKQVSDVMLSYTIDKVNGLLNKKADSTELESVQKELTGRIDEFVECTADDIRGLFTT